MFAVDVTVARRLRAFLDSALRIWATSLRGTCEAINREAAYEKLCLTDDMVVGEHDLVPPSPFFGTRTQFSDEVVSLLFLREDPIVFISGEPGSGKTALISSLANRSDPAVNARYYAYRPITPENQLLPADAGRTTTPRALWSDLLLEIRELARGRMAELQIPVHAASLTVDSLRGHVLRLANALGERQGRPFVIAIDGIDHAARAGATTESFLKSLVPPDQVPPHVVFLIGGQPPDGYPNYPSWLRASCSGVTRIDLPGLEFSDTLALVRARLAETPEGDQLNAARDIWQHCQGHVLSTVFAVEEAVSVAPDLSRLSEQLETRRLASGVEAYYNEIWSSVCRAFPIDATGVRLAACLCLMPIRVTASMVSAVFQGAEEAALNWSDLLRQLRPLVVEESGGFRVFQNDVRVFLHRIIQAEDNLYRDCAFRLADYLIRAEDVAARHQAALNLLVLARRYRDRAAMFTPQYVLEGHAIGESLELLTDQGLIAAEALASIEPDWDIAHTVATGVRTVEQLRSSLAWRSAEGLVPNVSSGIVATKSAERRVPARTEWDSSVVLSALSDISDLYEFGERDRATGTFDRWFYGVSPLDIALTAGPQHENNHVEQEDRHSLMRRFGRVCVELGKLPPSSDGDGAGEAEAGFASGLLLVASDCDSIRRFSLILNRIEQYYIRDAYGLLNQLFETRSWLRCKIFLSWMTPPATEHWAYRLEGAAVAALFDDVRLRDRWMAPVFLDRAATIQGATSVSFGAGMESEQLTAMAWSAFLFGFEEPTREASGIREEIMTVYSARQRDERDDRTVVQVLHAAALLGSFISTTRLRKPRALHVDPQSMSQAIAALSELAHTKMYVAPPGFARVTTSIVRGIVEGSAYDREVAEAVRGVLTEQIRAGNRPNVLLETMWRALADTGDRDDLVSYADRWIGTADGAWDLAPADRHEIVQRIAALLDEIGEKEKAATARSRLPWLDIGFTGHKEYVLQQPLDWFLALAAETPSCWEYEGLRLFAVSREASRTGDNRLSSQIESEVFTAACIEGPSSIARFTRVSPSALEPGDFSIVSGLIGMAERVTIERVDLLAIWAFSTGQLCWQVKVDRDRLGEIRTVLEQAARRIGIADLSALMRRAAPAEFACEADSTYSDSASSNDAGSLFGVRVDEAMRAVCESRDWRGVSALLERIAVERPAEAQDAVALAWAALGRRGERVWWFDGADPAYEAIFPLLAAAERWGAVCRAVTARDQETPESRSRTLAENLDDLCRLAAIANGADAVQRGLRRLLDMLELWISGGGNLPPLKQVPIADNIEEVPSWPSLFVELLFQLLAFDEQTYLQAALRGLDRLFLLHPTLYRDAVALASAAKAEVSRRFHLMAEALAIRADAVEIRDWLSRESESSQLDVALSSWVALRTANRALGVPEISWPQPTVERPLIVPVARPLVIRPRTSHGLRTSVSRASTTILNHLEAALDSDVGDLRSELAASIRDDPPQPRSRRMRGKHVRDMVSNGQDDAEVERLFMILRVRERQGRFAGVPISRLAQALVPFADPFVFLRSPQSCSTASSWPVDAGLDTLVLSGPTSLREKLDAIIEADLDPSVRMVGGVIKTFSEKFDASLSVDHVVRSGSALSLDKNPIVLNARSSLAFEDGRTIIRHPGASDHEWLTQEVGGLLPFVDATLDSFPGRSWLTHLSWEPSAQNPLVWTRDGRPVAWYERSIGPIRHLYPNDFAYRQPSVARWVCLTDEWKRLSEILGTHNRRVRSE